MTGLVSLPTSPANVAGLFGGMVFAASVPETAASGAAIFLDMLGLLPDAESEPENDGEEFSFIAYDPPFAAPQQIANAVIRSMLPTVEPVLMMSTVDALEPEVIPTAPSAIERPESEAWDLPFDWVAPEELTDPYEEVPDRPLPAYATPVAVQAPLSTQPEVLLPAVTASAKPLPVNRPPASGSRPPATAAPLAFAVKVQPAASADPPRDMLVPVHAPQTPDRESLHPEVVATQGVAPARTESVASTPSRTTDSGPALVMAAQPEHHDRQTEEHPESQDTEDTNRGVEPAPNRESAVAKTDPEPVSKARSPILELPAATPSSGPALVPVEPRGAAPRLDPPSEPALEPRGELQPTRETANPEVRPAVAREIAIRISAPDAVPVDVQLRERGGELRVAVRTNDAGLQVSLRQDLGSLVNQLENAGFQAETMVPRELPVSSQISPSFDLSSTFRTAAVNQTDPSEANPDRSQDGGSARQQTEDSSGRQSHQRRQNSSRHFKWMQAMEDRA